jgi:crotonobetainyl-CoA:carnitine CoA-transferase CaiB-like acyl-CoA transferase
MMVEHLGGITFDPATGPVCYFRQIDPDRQPFPAKDGAVSIVPYTEAAWPELFRLLGEPQALDDPRFATRELRMANVGALYRKLAEITPRFTCAEIETMCRSADIPVRIARDIAEIRDDPHLAAIGFFTRREHPSEGAFYEMKHPVLFAARPEPERSLPPHLDEHGEAVRGAKG